MAMSKSTDVVSYSLLILVSFHYHKAYAPPQLTLPVFLAQFVDNVLEIDSGACMVFADSVSGWLAERGQGLDEDTGDEEPLFTPSKPVLEATRSNLDKKEKEKDDQLKRQVGDVSLWAYYAKFIGVGYIFLLALFTLMYVLGSTFPRQSPNNISFLQMLTYI
jgi:hypothetical protein